MNGDIITARFIQEAAWNTFPGDVREKSKMCFLDNLASLVSGSRTKVSRIAADFAAACYPGDESTIILHDKKSSAMGAAFANGCAANGLDTDDGARYAYGHAGAQIFPVALALTEALELDGSALLTAMVVGYEVAHRIGRCWHDDHSVYQACGSWGSVACSAVAAHLMRLDADAVKRSLGVADYYAPNLPMMRDIAHPSMVKHGTGWGAMTGIAAAQLASRGFTSIPTLLSKPKYYKWVKDIGENYLMVDGVGWKAKGFACCGWAHAAAEGSRKLIEANRIEPAQIEKIIVETFAEAAALGTSLPASAEEAQFNLAWPVAAMLVDGEIGPDQTQEERLGDEMIRGLAARVEVRETNELNELARLFQQGDPRGRFASSVILVLRDGTRLESGLVEGEFSYPPTDWNKNRMEEKFRWLVEPVVGGKLTDDLIELGWGFDGVDSVKEVTGPISRYL